LITSIAGQLLLRAVDHPVQALIEVQQQDGDGQQRQRTHDRKLFLYSQHG
jgi:hypothetical protein